jgi:hypothetical protein
LKNVIEAYESKSKSGNPVETRNENREVIPTKFKVPKVQHEPSSLEVQKQEKSINIEQATQREAQERRRRKAQEKCEQ